MFARRYFHQLIPSQTCQVSRLWFNSPGFPVCHVVFPALPVFSYEIIFDSKTISSVFQSVFFWRIKLFTILKKPQKYRKIGKQWTEHLRIRFGNFFPYFSRWSLFNKHILHLSNFLLCYWKLGIAIFRKTSQWLLLKLIDRIPSRQLHVQS